MQDHVIERQRGQEFLGAKKKQEPLESHDQQSDEDTIQIKREIELLFGSANRVRIHVYVFHVH